MKQMMLLAAAAVLSLYACDDASAAGRRPVAAGVGKVHAPIQGRAPVLYSQNDDDNKVSINSQKYEDVLDHFDTQAADDFVVPDGHTWKITEVDVTGVYYSGSGPAASQRVAIYRNARGGRPSGIIKFAAVLTGVDNGSGSFAISLGKGVRLRPGTYWLSVQTNLNYGSNENQWGWETRNTQVNKPAVWRNPNDGFGTGCTSFAVETDCLHMGQGPDLMFALRGRDLLQ